jgi:uncharacterized protein YbaR (Trm112 family)
MVAISKPTASKHEPDGVPPNVAQSTLKDTTIDSILERELLRLLVCPRDHLVLEGRDGHLICPSGHRYPVVDGIPILLLSETQQTHVEGTRSLQVGASGGSGPTPLPSPPQGEIDPFVQNVIAATNAVYPPDRQAH